MNSAKLQTLKVQLYSNRPLVGAGQRRKAAEALAQDGSPEAVGLLAEAVTRSDDEQVRGIAIAALRKQAKQGGLEAQQALCRLVIEYDHPTAREIVLAEQYAPQERNQQALFYFLTEQWEKYEQLDFDSTLLEVAYEAANEKLRRQIAEKARQAGRIEWVQIVAGGRQRQRLGAMTDAEWEATLAVLARGKQWEEMWQLAQVAPVEWSVRFLRRLDEVKWTPQGAEERAAFAEFVGLARKCEGEVLELNNLVRCYVALKGHSKAVSQLSISPNSQLLASGSFDNTVRLWSLPNGQHLKTLVGHTGTVWRIAISPNGQLLASGSADSTVRLWSLPNGQQQRTLAGHTETVWCIAISPDGKLLASGSDDSTVRLWSLPDGRYLKTLNGHVGRVCSLAITPDSTLIASAGADNTVRLWSLPDGQHLNTLEGHSFPVICLAISPNGKLLATGSNEAMTFKKDGTVRLWRLPDGQPHRILEGHTRGINSLVINPTGELLASGSDDNTIRFWSLPHGQHLKTLEGHKRGINYLAISPDGGILASGGQDSKRLKLWSLQGGNLLKTLQPNTGWSVDDLANSPDGRVLVSGGTLDSRDNTSQKGAYTLQSVVYLWTLDWLRLSRLPVSQTTVEDLRWVKETLRCTEVSKTERVWLEFLLALMRWRRRFDIEVEDAPQKVDAGEFDIELE